MNAVRIASDRIAVNWDGREYGTNQTLEEQFLQRAPGAFQEVAATLRKESTLLALTASPQLEKRTVLEAYGADIMMLQQCVAEFEACAREAIRCSIIIHRGQRAAGEKLWAELQQAVPAIGRVPLVDLPFDRAAKPTSELLSELQQEFGQAVARVLQLFAFWLQRLMEKEFVGLVEWGGLDTCRYHYFRHERTDTVLSDHTRYEQRYDASQPLGQRTEYRTVRDRVVREERFHERHVHHIVYAKLHPLDEYAAEVPRHIQRFLDAVPSRLRPFFQIVSGQITKQEILRRGVGETTRAESEVLAVWKGSPGILFGPFNLIGWSDDDLKAEAPGAIRRFLTQLVSR